MNSVLYLIPISIGLAVLALLGFYWSLKTRQYDDPDGDAARILIDEDIPLSR